MKTDFHFHEWAFLARTDAAAFERRRKLLLEEFLFGVGPHRQKLLRLQAEVDRRRAASDTPQQAVAAISGMMCHSFCALVGELGSLRKEMLRLQSLHRQDKACAEKIAAPLEL